MQPTHESGLHLRLHFSVNRRSRMPMQGVHFELTGFASAAVSAAVPSRCRGTLEETAVTSEPSITVAGAALSRLAGLLVTTRTTGPASGEAGNGVSL